MPAIFREHDDNGPLWPFENSIAVSHVVRAFWSDSRDAPSHVDQVLLQEDRTEYMSGYDSNLISFSAEDALIVAKEMHRIAVQIISERNAQ